MSINRRLAFKSAAVRAAERRQQGFDDVFLISFLERRSPCGMETLWKLRSVVGDLGGTSPTVRLDLHLPGINNDW